MKNDYVRKNTKTSLENGDVNLSSRGIAKTVSMSSWMLLSKKPLRPMIATAEEGGRKTIWM